MKRKINGIRRILAFLLCVVLMISNTGITAFAMEEGPAVSEENYADETLAMSDAQESGEEMAVPGEASNESFTAEDSAIGEPAEEDFMIGESDIVEPSEEDDLTDELIEEFVDEEIVIEEAELAAEEAYEESSYEEEPVNEAIEDSEQNRDGDGSVSWIVSFDAGDGTGTMEQVSVPEGESFTLPECGFNAPSNKEFDKWRVGNDYDNLKSIGETIEITEDITLTAVWKWDVGTWEGLRNALNDWDEVTLTKDVVSGEGDLELRIYNGTKAVLDLNGFTITQTNHARAVFTVYGKLTLNDSKETGRITGGCYGVEVNVMRSNNEVAFTMNGGTITGCEYGIYSSQGLPGYNVSTSYVTAIQMNGGQITGNSGRGVYIRQPSTGGHHYFSIYGGTISDNGGGVYIEGNSSLRTVNFHLCGGTICNNSAENGAGLYIYTLCPGIVGLEGGSICNNTASGNGGGVYIYSPYNANTVTFSMKEGCSVSGNTAANGGGLYLEGDVQDGTSVSLTMDGGSINDNSSETGGGVYLKNSTMEMKNTSSISSNTARGGGGVYTTGRTTFRLKGGTISNNAASQGNGGGFYQYHDEHLSEFVMTGGEIKNNLASSLGGGIYICGYPYSSTAEPAEPGFTQSSTASITGNSAGENGGGVYLQNNSSAPLYYHVAGDAVVTGNTVNNTANNVYLTSRKVMTVSGNLTDAASIGVTMQSAGVFTEGLSGFGTPAAFFSDNGSYLTGQNANGEALLGVPVSVSFTPGEAGSGTMEDVTVASGGLCILPDCTLTPPDNRVFYCWKIGSEEYFAGSAVTITENTEASAVWEKPWVTVWFEAGEGTGAMDPVQATPSRQYVFPECTFTAPENKMFHRWMVGETYYEPGDAISLTEGSDLTVTAVWRSCWSSLQDKCNAGGLVVLDRDYNAIEGDSALVIPADASVNLDLNGHTINRNLEVASGDGSAVKVFGTLTVNGAGMITGGKNTGNGGGVYVAEGGSLTMTGGTITGNTAAVGGGVYVDGSLGVSGNPVITENRAGESENNVYLPSGKIITVESDLTGDTSVGITMETPGVFTLGLAGHGTAAAFSSDDWSLITGEDDSGEAIIYNPGLVTVEFDANGGSGSMDSVSFAAGRSYVLPSCGFTEPADTSFYRWQVGEDTENLKEPGESITVLENTVIKAVWKSYWSDLQDLTRAGGTIVLHRNYVAYTGDTPLEIPAGVNVILDMNGYTIDRNLETAEEDGCAIKVLGTLTVRNIGVITGGNNTGNGGGIYVAENGSLTVQKCTITGNSAQRGGGVYANGIFRISDSPVITGNTAGGYANNVFLVSGKTISVTSRLTNSTSVGITMEVPGVFTTGLSGHGTPDRFFSDDPDYLVGQNVAGEALVGTPVTVHFDPGTGSSGSMENMEVVSGAQFRLPSCGFTPPTGHQFAGWQVGNNDEDLLPAASYTAVEEDTVITARWQPIPMTVVFDANGGTGSMDNVTVNYGSSFELPACAFIGPDNRPFYKWMVNHNVEDLKDPDTSIVITESVTITALWDSDADTWDELQAAMNTGGRIMLQSNVTAAAGDSCLVIPSGKAVILDLNGCVIDRGLNAAQTNGHVLSVAGTLILSDSTGTGGITGGNSSSSYGGGICLSSGASFIMNGGAIYNNSSVRNGGGVCLYGSEAVFTMNGGSISGNSTTHYGGGVCLYGRDTAFTMNGGSINNNNAEYLGGGLSLANSSAISMLNAGSISNNRANFWGGGIYVTGESTLCISGGASVTENSEGSLPGNVYLADDAYIHVTDTLENMSPIGVMKNDGGVFTTGLSGHGGISAFISDSNNYEVRLTDEGEAWLARKCDFTFTENTDGGGEYVTFTAAEGDSYTIPEYMFTVPDGGRPFGGWRDYEGNVYLPGETITVSYSMYFYPWWKNDWDFLQDAVSQEYNNGGSRYVLDRDYTAENGNVPLKIPEGFTLDLNGHILSAPDTMRYAVGVSGGSIANSNTGTAGRIEGGIAFIDASTLSGVLSVDRFYIFDPQTVRFAADYQPEDTVTVCYRNEEYFEPVDFGTYHSLYLEMLEMWEATEMAFAEQFAFTDGWNDCCSSDYFIPELPDLYYLAEVEYISNGVSNSDLVLYPKMIIDYDSENQDLYRILTTESLYVKPGDRVTLRADRAAEISGVSIDEIYYNTEDSSWMKRPVEITGDEETGIYTFIMPFNDIIIRAENGSLMEGFYHIQIYPYKYASNGGGEEKSLKTNAIRSSSYYDGETVVWASAEVDGVPTSYARAGEEVVINVSTKGDYRFYAASMLDSNWDRLSYDYSTSNGTQLSFVMPNSDVSCELYGQRTAEFIIRAEHGTMDRIMDVHFAWETEYKDTDFIWLGNNWMSQNHLQLSPDPDEGYVFEPDSLGILCDEDTEHYLFEVDPVTGKCNLDISGASGPVTLTASFVPEDTVYDITVEGLPEDVECRFRVDDHYVEKASPGQTVILEPEDGWELSWLSVDASYELQAFDTSVYYPIPVYAVGENQWGFTMPALPVSIAAEAVEVQTEPVTTWNDFVTALENGGTVKLGNNIANPDGGQISLNGTAVIEMNGYSIDMNDGIINVQGNLAVNNGSFTGGTAILQAVGFSSLTLNNCSAEEETPVGIQMLHSSDLYLKGKNSISIIEMMSYNSEEVQKGHIFIDSNMEVPDEPFVISSESPCVLTDGWAAWKAKSENSNVVPEDCFVAIANGGLALDENDDGELYLDNGAVVTFRADFDGSSETYMTSTISGKTFTLPECQFEPPIDKKFWQWQVGSEGDELYGLYAPGDEIVVTNDLVVTALWKGKVLLEAVSLDENDEDVGGDIQIEPDTGYLYEGDRVTLTAPVVGGYTFLGWFSGEEFRCETLKYTFTIDADTSLIARYRARGEVMITVNCINEAKFRFGNNDAVQSGGLFPCKLGSTQMITAVDPEKVLQWQNASGKILGQAGSLPVKVTGETSITLVYKTVSTASQAYLQFVSDYGQVLYSSQITQNTEFNYPAAPSKFGYEFDKWVFEGTEEEATKEAIRAKITGEPDTIITVKPSYNKLEITYTVTVEHVYGENTDTEVIPGIPIGTSRTFAARNYDGFKFQCWEIDGETVSFTEGYFMTVSRDLTLTARYVTLDVEVEAEPMITIGKLFTVESGTTHKVSGQVTRSIPDGYELIEHGVLYARDPSAALDEDTFVYDGGVGKYTPSTTGMTGVVTLNVRVDNDYVDVWMRGYMLLLNKVTGEERAFYSGIVHGTYASVYESNHQAGEE